MTYRQEERKEYEAFQSLLGWAFEQGQDAGYRSNSLTPVEPAFTIADFRLFQAWRRGVRSGYHTRNIAAYIRGEMEPLE